MVPERLGVALSVLRDDQKGVSCGKSLGKTAWCAAPRPVGGKRHDRWQLVMIFSHGAAGLAGSTARLIHRRAHSATVPYAGP